MMKTKLTRKCQKLMNNNSHNASRSYFARGAAFVIAALLAFNAYAQSDDFGMDFSLGAEKKLSSNINLAVDANARTQDNTSKMERWGVGAALDMKVYNTKTFDIKTSLGWEYIWQNKLATCEDWTSKKTGLSKGYKEKDGYWRNRHRTSLGFAASYKPNKRWKYSLKETFQYNHYCESSTDIYKYASVNSEYGQQYELDETEHKIYNPKDLVILRSKLAIQYDIKHSPFSPFASADYGCGINYTANKWKFAAGTDFNINKKNKLSIYYRFQTENDDDEPNGHILGLGYNIKL